MHNNTREIWHEILVHADPLDIYQAVTETSGLSHWWTTDVRGGPSEIGSKLEFWFSGFLGSVMEVTGLETGKLVRWRVLSGGAADWIGTNLEFKIFQDQGKTLLHFRHSNWAEDAKTFPHCSLGWAIFLISLKEYVETGKGRPHPFDMPINLWRPPQSKESHS